MVPSKKFKHGEYIINVGPNEDGTDIGKILRHSPAVGKRKKRYEQAFRGGLHASPIDREFSICDWVNPPDITWIDEKEIRLATKAEIVLYGRKKV